MAKTMSNAAREFHARDIERSRADVAERVRQLEAQKDVTVARSDLATLAVALIARLDLGYGAQRESAALRLELVRLGLMKSEAP